MSQKILLPTDFSEYSAAATKYSFPTRIREFA